ncbi:thioredoxin domain-containing protein [Nitratireductor sp. ZSWI3]|uniref:thioredoxin domain-containing protein n=1 Tax=Nitratireductor sp. ZSWI3 TaxID=2966359 RepID=UPI0027E2A715|nr:thioredoxin domain-containing protein [Nitratireductor sp. ZSWI3]
MFGFAVGRRHGRRLLMSVVLISAFSGLLSQGRAGAFAAAPDMEALLDNGALEEKVLGAEDAPVTIIEYSSMTCGHCARFHTEVFPSLKARYVETGKVRYIMRSLPTDPRAEAGLMLAYCAGDDYFVVSTCFTGGNPSGPGCPTGALPC